MSETPEVELDLNDLQEYVTRIEAGAAIIYSLLNEIYALHTENEEVCSQCEKPSPCPTVQILLSAMVEEKPAE
jgi:hypothetical protein